MKRCKSCGEEKLLSEYHKTSRTKDGRIARCKVCKAAYNKPEEKRAYDLVYRAENRDRRLAGYKKYAVEHSEEIASYNRTEIRREQGRVNERKKRARRAELPYETYTTQQVIDRDGPQCWMCGCVPTGRNRTVEHLIAILTSSEDLIKWKIEHPGDVLANVAIACQSCNSRKLNRIMPCALARHYTNLLGSTHDQEGI